MKRILYKINNLTLGSLVLDKKGYVFVANDDVISKAESEFPLEMRLFRLNTSGLALYEKLPYPFNEYVGYTERLDIKQKAEINSEDSDFEKLYKLAGLEIAPYNRFTIAQG